ncbi:hypothetical protein [Paracoccus benzoatiresistens]|uniref:Uncharacterized protein n=1 Tax=Paracoccus benzoatiresistens TaxID=2997341 RepID=A0ABT4J5Y4_9RHOB|nr:hypothetical protein [Paracoccus sp. EF6]MCZ0962523.1 hypothetical protein [Paracoccus sp. EF6]
MLVYGNDDAGDWSDYVFDMVVHPADDDTIGAVFYWQDENNHYELSIDQQTFTRQLVRVESGQRTVLAQESGAYRHHAEQDLRIAVSDRGIIVTLDDQLLDGPVIDSDPLEGGTVGVLSRSISRASFDEVSVNGQVLSARALGQHTATDLDGNGREGIPVTAAATISPVAVASYDWLTGDKVVATGRDAVIDAPVGASQVTLRVTDVNGNMSQDRIDLQVTGRDKLMFADDFSGSLKRYTIVDDGTNGPSDWRIADDALVQDSNIGGGQQEPGWDAWSKGGEGAYIMRDGTHSLVKGGEDWIDYAVEVDVTPSDDDALEVLVRYVDDQHHYKVELDDQAGLAQIILVEDGYETVLARGWHNYAQDESMRLRVEAEGRPPVGQRGRDRDLRIPGHRHGLRQGRRGALQLCQHRASIRQPDGDQPGRHAVAERGDGHGGARPPGRHRRRRPAGRRGRKIRPAHRRRGGGHVLLRL